MSSAISWKKVVVVRPQPGHAETCGVKLRRASDWSTCCATCTSSVRSPPGRGVRDTRIVSPMPSCKRIDRPAVLAMMPFAPIPASVSPRCSGRSEEHTSELQSQSNLVCRLLLEKKKKKNKQQKKQHKKNKKKKQS